MVGIEIEIGLDLEVWVLFINSKVDIARTLTYNVKVHPTAIREALYHSPHDSNEHDFATCGYDGRLQCFDDRDPQIGQMYWKNRGRLEKEW